LFRFVTNLLIFNFAFIVTSDSNSTNGITFYSVFQNNGSNYWTSTLSDLAGQGVLNPMLVFSDGTMQVGGQGSTGSGERCVRDH